jgi:hypothetical protein
MGRQEIFLELVASMDRLRDRPQRSVCQVARTQLDLYQTLTGSIPVGLRRPRTGRNAHPLGCDRHMAGLLIEALAKAG